MYRGTTRTAILCTSVVHLIQHLAVQNMGKKPQDKRREDLSMTSLQMLTHQSGSEENSCALDYHE